MSFANVRIVNKTGITNDTKVYVNDKELTGITRIAIEPFVAGQVLRANLTLNVAEVDVIVSEAETEYTDRRKNVGEKWSEDTES